jgi:hypothetical protein
VSDDEHHEEDDFSNNFSKNSSDEEPEDSLAYVNRKLKAGRLGVGETLVLQQKKWQLEGRDLGRRKVEALEALREPERGRSSLTKTNFPLREQTSNASSSTARLPEAGRRHRQQATRDRMHDARSGRGERQADASD